MMSNPRAFFLMVAFLLAVGEASKAADATFLDRSAGAMDRSELIEDGQGCDIGSDDQCKSGRCCNGDGDTLKNGVYCYDGNGGKCADTLKADGEQCWGADKACISKKCCDGTASVAANGAVCEAGTSTGLCATMPAPTGCPRGWIQLDNTCGGAEETTICTTLGAPLKYVSWLHLQYECDKIGGYLPEPTADNLVNLQLILSSLHSLYAKGTPILMYLGATDITRKNDWKWLKSNTELTGAEEAEKWSEGVPDNNDNKDCLAVQSSDNLWKNVDCENDSMENQIANICFGSPATAKELPLN